MATVSELRAQETIITSTSPIAEPLNAPSLFQERLKRFGDHYNTANESHLYRYLVALCGDTGAGSIKKELLLPRLKERLESTHFYDLDRLYGDALALPRLSPELYTYDPENEVLTASEWAEIRSKDAEYRQRCLLWMRAIIEGSSLEGIRLAGQAATGIECDVFERYKYLDNTTGVVNIGATSSRNEFIIQPRTTSITEQEKRRIMRLVDRIRPVNTVPYIAADAPLRTIRQVTDVASSSNWFFVNRYVTGNPNVNWPPVDLTKGYWIESNVEKEAPLFAFMDRREAVTYLSVVDVLASTEHVGSFNQNQRLLFAHLSDTPDHFYQYRADRSYARNIAPVNLTVPWQKSERGITVVNNYYPLGYFAEANTDSFVQPPQEQFWASEEKPAGESDYLIFDFGRERPLNFIDFEVSQKPIDFVIEWDNNGVWTPITPVEDRPVSMQVDYLPSVANPWSYFEVYFHLVQTQRVRITFQRGTRRFPTETSDSFDYSIEVRGARLIHTIAEESSFVADTGVDVLGNSFRTELETRPAQSILTQQTVNYCINPSFETNVNRWNIGNTVTRTNAQAKFGTWSGSWAYLGGPNEGIGYATDNIFTEGQTVTCSAWIRPTSTITMDAQINEHSVAPAFLRYTPGPSTVCPAGVWTRIKNTVTLGPDTVSIALYLTTQDAPGSAQTIYTDGVMIELSSEATDYIDGSMPGGVWHGTAHASETYTALPSFWQSQPNPTRHAVEALYFDLRRGEQIGTMAYLNTLNMDELDDRSMAEMAKYHEDGQLIDEVFIDPITYGPDMHFYYSNDDTPAWDNKLWIPIPRHYTLKKGYHALPQPTRVRYFKIEFCNLTPYPYQAIEYPAPRPIRFRRFPTWVKDYFATIYQNRPKTPDRLEVLERVVIDPLSFGFRKVDDKLVSNYEAARLERIHDTDSEVKNYIDDVINARDPGLREEVESRINFRSPLQWQADLVALLDTSRALSRVATLPREEFFDTGWTVELGLPLDPIPTEGSTVDQAEAIADRQEPTLWFPRRARHQYQIVEAPITNKVAYLVAVKKVEFHRRNYTVQHDEVVYTETLDDTAHILSNDFTQNEWRYEIEI